MFHAHGTQEYGFSAMIRSLYSSPSGFEGLSNGTKKTKQAKRKRMLPIREKISLFFMLEARKNNEQIIKTTQPNILNLVSLFKVSRWFLCIIDNLLLLHIEDSFSHSFLREIVLSGSSLLLKAFFKSSV